MHHIMLMASDRGYFGTPAQPTFAAHGYRVGFVHSYGLHWCPWLADPLPDTATAPPSPPLDLLVVFSSFLDFHPPHPRGRRRSQLIVQQMIHDCQHQPHEVLRRFYATCGFSEAEYGSMLKDCNRDRLVADLQDLNRCHLALSKVKNIPLIVIFHAAADQIVSLEKGQELFRQINLLNPTATHYVEIEKAGHALPFTHLHACWDGLLPFLKSTPD